MDSPHHEREQLELAFFYLDNAHIAWGCRAYADMGEAERRLGVAYREEDPRIWNDAEFGATLDEGDAYDCALGAIGRLLCEADPGYYDPVRRQGREKFRLAVEARLAGRGRMRAVR